MRIDSHCHTNCSDGNVSIEERIQMVRSSGLDAATITDHDFISQEQVDLARECCGEIPFIPGIELSLNHENKIVHLLGYFIDPQDSGLQRHIAAVQAHDVAITLRLIDHYRQRYGYDVRLDQLRSNAFHTFYSMSFIRKSAADLFGNDSQRSMAAFNDAETALGLTFADFSPWDVRAAIDLLHSAGGIAVLAHPGGRTDAMMQKLGFLAHEEFHIRRYADWGLDGIETGTPVHSEQEKNFYNGLCHQYELLATAGSDCHGDDPYLGKATMGVFMEFAPDSYELMCACYEQRQKTC